LDRILENENSNKPDANPARTGRPPGLYAAYAAGFFSLSLVPMTFLAVPLWALNLHASPAMIGVAIASRSFLPLFFSIHGGVMMDRLGTRRMTLLFTLSGAALSFLYPLLPWLSALIVLQLLVGLAQGMGWIGAQTKMARMTRGDPVYAGRFSFSTTLGIFLGPLLVGKAWDVVGPWGAFGLIGIWGGCLSLAVFLLPAPGATLEHGRRRLQLKDFLPKFNDYKQALALLAIPGVALVIAVTFLRISAVSVQGSFYTVYLENIEFTGTQIGALIGLASLIGSPAALLVGPASRFVGVHWVMLATVGISIVSMCITPLFDNFTVLLLFAGFFGVGMGAGLPSMLSILAGATGHGQQGRSVGLRTTANRLASFVVPLLMGLIVEWAGIEMGFLVVALLLLSVLAVVGMVVHRSPAFAVNAPTRRES
jgi:MFS family permease